MIIVIPIFRHMATEKHKVGDVVKSDSKFDYVVTDLGPKLLYRVQYENLDENFDELVPAEKVKDLDDNLFSSKENSANFSVEGDKVKVLLFGDWKTATIIGTEFGECEVTCFKKGSKKSYFSEWITLTAKGLTSSTKKEGENENPFLPNEPAVTKKSADINSFMKAEKFQKVVKQMQFVLESENWGDILDKLNSFYIKPQWDGKSVGDDYHVFILSCNFDHGFKERLKILLESHKLRVTSNEHEIHRSRVLLLLYTDNACYDAKLIRLLTRGAELANNGELCIKVLVHPTCSAFRQSRIPDNMAYSLAESKWYNWTGVDSPSTSFYEMVSQIQNYTSETKDTKSNALSGIWYCKIVVSGDYCSNFYDNKSMTLLLNQEKNVVHGRTPSGLILEGNFDGNSRSISITGTYCGPWAQNNEGWKEEYVQIMIKIDGVMDFKGSKFEGQICEIFNVGDKFYECVGTLSATLENEGVSGFYEVTDAISQLKGDKMDMVIVQQRGSDLMVDIMNYHGTMYPGVIDTQSRCFWIYIHDTPFSCTTYKGVLSCDPGTHLQVNGYFFKCENGITVIPKTKFEAKRVHGFSLDDDSGKASTVFEQLVNEAEPRSLRNSVINSYTYVPPNLTDYPILLIGAEQDDILIQDLKTNLYNAGIQPISCSPKDLFYARTVCLLLSCNIRDNIKLIDTVRQVAAKDVPFFIIATDARRNIFDDKYWKDVDLKETLLSCLARLKQTGKITLNPNTLLFKTLVKEIKSHYMPPVYFLSGMWSVRTFNKVETDSGFEQAALDARKGKQKTCIVPKLLYILCDGMSGNVVGINDFVSSKEFKGSINNETGTFIFDNEDSKYELMIERDGQIMQGTYINRLHNFQLDMTLTLEIDDISGVYTVKNKNLMIGIVKTGQHSIDVHYCQYILPGVFYGSYFYCTIPRFINRKPTFSTMCGVLQKSQSGSSLVCFEYASLANMRCHTFQFDQLQTSFQKLDEVDKTCNDCEPYIDDFIDKYADSINDIDYEVYKNLHADDIIEKKDVFEAYCKLTHDNLGKISGQNFVGKRKMLETNLSHLTIYRYEFDMIYTTRVRREFFIIDENCQLKGTMSLEDEALQFHSSIYDVMITYRSLDSGWADLLQTFLENNEILCWRDQRMEIGANWSSDITSAIRLAKCELCLLSEEYLKSEMCTKEISLAYDSGKLIIPLVLPYTDQTKTRPLVKSTYRPSYPPHQISHETSQSTWIDFRPASSSKDPENVEDFQKMYREPLKILLDRLRLSKSRLLNTFCFQYHKTSMFDIP